MTTTAERNAAVLAVLKASDIPLSPSEIASKIRQPWCFDEPRFPKTAPISRVCKRIGAVQAAPEDYGFGKWFAPVVHQ
jgi:hypothetical protein